MFKRSVAELRQPLAGRLPLGLALGLLGLLALAPRLGVLGGDDAHRRGERLVAAVRGEILAVGALAAAPPATTATGAVALPLGTAALAAPAPPAATAGRGGARRAPP